MVNSPLRWAGSKRSLLGKIRAVWPQTTSRYFEPFMGSACVFFDAVPPRAQLSDFNAELVQFFRQLQSSPTALAQAFLDLDATGERYYEVRNLNPEALSDSARAARFLYLNRFAFNGVYRTNRSGQFNVPRGVRTGALPTTTDLIEASALLEGATISLQDWRSAIADAGDGDFVYLDPPYRNQHRSTYGEYGYGSFSTSSDVQQLADELRRLNEAGAKVLLSFNDDDELGDALDGWAVDRIERRRTVAGSSPSRTTLKGEILAMNYSVEAAVA